MRIAVFSTKTYDKDFLEQANHSYGFHFHFFADPLNPKNAYLAKDYDAVCAFVNDDISQDTLRILKKNNINLIAMRCAGINNIDLKYAKEHDIKIVNVPNYSPYGVAEHTIALMLTLNRKIHRAYTHVREGNFSLEGLLGFNMHGKTVGIIGTGKIGLVVAKILFGFGCKILAFDRSEKPQAKEFGVEYVNLQTLCRSADIITLHCPLFPETKHIINETTISEFKPGMMLINTSRGALIDTHSIIKGLKTGKIAYLGLDVYEEEQNIFFQDLSTEILQDDTFARLLTFPNVVITSHQAYFTKEALTAIAETTLENIQQIQKKQNCPNLL